MKNVKMSNGVKKEIVLSGMQPTGLLHIANYLAALKNFVSLQDKHDCYFFIADYHSLTAKFDPKKKPTEVFDLALDYLAIGLDPKKCTVFVQSDVPEVTELTWIFNCLTGVSELFRMTQYKEKVEEQKTRLNVGLFTYPILQAADILIYKANLVPVGADQLQHLELTRDICRAFNRRFVRTFPEPKPLLTKTPKIMSLLLPEKKMSKGLGGDHCIFLSDSPEVIRRKIKKAVTDIGPGKQEEMSPGVANLFLLLENFGAREVYQQFKDAYKNGVIRYSELKSALSKAIADYFAEFRQKRKDLTKQPEYIKTVLRRGAEKARKAAVKTMLEVRQKVGID